MVDPKDDAGDLYRQAIADYDANTTAYTDLQNTRDFNEAQVTGLKGLDLICQAATCSAMHLFSTHPEEIVGYETNIPTLDKLIEIKKTMSNVILLAKFEKNYDLASKYANALAAMGFRLYKERDAYVELDAGEDFLGTGNDSLIEITKAQHADDKLTIQARCTQSGWKNSRIPSNRCGRC